MPCHLWGEIRIWLLFMGEDSTCDTRPLNICVVVRLQCVTYLLIRKLIFINSNLHFGHTFSWQPFAAVVSFICNHNALCVCRSHASFSWLLYQIFGSFAMEVKMAVPLQCINNIRCQRRKPCWKTKAPLLRSTKPTWKFIIKSRFVALKQKPYIWSKPD